MPAAAMTLRLTGRGPMGPAATPQIPSADHRRPLAIDLDDDDLSVLIGGRCLLQKPARLCPRIRNIARVAPPAGTKPHSAVPLGAPETIRPACGPAPASGTTTSFRTPTTTAAAPRPRPARRSTIARRRSLLYRYYESSKPLLSAFTWFPNRDYSEIWRLRQSPTPLIIPRILRDQRYAKWEKHPVVLRRQRKRHASNSPLVFIGNERLVERSDKSQYKNFC